MFGLTPEKLHGHLALARVSNSPTIFTNVFVGAALAGGLNFFSVVKVLALCISILAFYFAGMYLNDLCDFKYDKEHRGDRPLVTGVVSYREAQIVCAVLFLLALVILSQFGLALLVQGLVLTGLIVLYDFWHKGNPLSPVVMGANRFMVYLIAFSAFSPNFYDVLIPGALLWLYIVGITWVAKAEVKNDLSSFAPVLTLVMPFFYVAVNVLLGSFTTIPFILGCVFLLWVATAVYFMYAKRKVGMGVGLLLAGICLVDSLFLAGAVGLWGGLLGVCGFLATLLLQRYIEAT